MVVTDPHLDPALLRVLMVSSSFPADGRDWRAVFMRQLADALGRRSGLKMDLWAPPGETGRGVTHDLRGDESQWLAQLMADGGIAHLLRSRPLHGAWTAVGLLRRLRGAYRRNTHANVYHVNWLQNALALPDDGKSLLLTALGSDLQLLRIPGVRLAVKRVLRNRRAIVCPNAQWMVAPLREALGSQADIRAVPFGIDASWYEVKRGPVTGPPKWLAVTRLTKGKLGDLFTWSAPLFDGPERELHLFGPMQEHTEVPHWVHYHGPATPEALREQWFPRASGLITLSRHAEGRPQVMLESMAAGLPIIASDIEAHSNFLQHGETAWICDNEAAYGAGLAFLEDGSCNAAVGQAARGWVADAVGTWDDAANRYHSLYQELVESLND